MSTPFIGELRTFSFNFAPRGWAFCNGQLLPIAQNQALFSILGTTYGGNGTTTFALPNLQGRVPIGSGSNGGVTYNFGQTGGTTTVTLSGSQVPAHTHNANGSSAAPSVGEPGPTVLPGNFTSISQNSYASSAGTAMAAGTVGNSVGGQPHENRQPYLALSIAIALQGIFPARN